MGKRVKALAVAVGSAALSVAAFALPVNAAVPASAGGPSHTDTTTPYAPWSAPVSPVAGDFGDLDRDGRADLLSRDTAGHLWFVSGTGRAVPLGGGWNVMTALSRHGATNGAGEPEDLVARDASGHLWMYEGNGRGGFHPRVRLGGGWNAMVTITMAGDLTGDGSADLLARDTSGILWLYPAIGHGHFGHRYALGGLWQSMTALVGPGDLNGDGKPDMLARDTSGRLWFYPGNGTSFDRRGLLGSGWRNLSLLGLGDVDGDGRPDLLAVSGSTVRLYPGNGTGSFGAYHVLRDDWTGRGGEF